MQLKIKRSQRTGGVMGNKVIFALDARSELKAEEKALVSKYALGKMVVYDSEARKKLTEAGQTHIAESQSGSAGHSVWAATKGLANLAIAAMSLRVSVDSLTQGHHIECKDMDELLGAEEAITEACRNLKGYLETAATFDGREVVIDF